MPVVAKSEYLSSPEDLLSRHHAIGYHPQAPPNQPHSVLLNGNTLRRSVFLFRAHHRACMERRKIGLSYELQVEAVRTGKFLEKIDCPSVSSATSKHTHSNNSTGMKTSNNTGMKSSGRHLPPNDMDTANFGTKPLEPTVSLNFQ